MAQLFPMPQLGSTMEEGTILKWHRAEGEAIRKGETLLEIETDKATMEVESPVDGVVRKLLYGADAVVAIQKPIAILGSADESIDHLLEPASQSSSTAAAASEAAAQSAPAPVRGGVEERIFISPRARRSAEERSIPVASLAGIGTGPGGRIIERDVAEYAQSHTSTSQTGGRAARLTPLAARLADDLGVDLNALAYGLPGSRVRKDDVLKHLEAAPVRTPHMSQSGDAYTSRPFAGMRRRIADNVSKSRSTAPHVTLVIEVDMTSCAELRSSIIGEIEKVYGTRLSFTDIMVKAAARALAEHPQLNSALVEDEIRTYTQQNIGVAVALEEGLVAPVVKAVGSKSLGEISAELKPLIERARTGKFTPDDVAGGTFTLTNLGSFAIDVFDPIIVPPQAAILGVCRIADKPAVHQGQLCIRSMMNLCLSFDHRVVDGAPAARFLQRLKELLENPVSVLI